MLILHTPPKTAQTNVNFAQYALDQGDGVIFLRCYNHLMRYIDIMPRKARIDAPCALHHIICRGIERCKIFRDDMDRSSFVERLGHVVTETQTPCYGWTLLPNHFHLLLKTGKVPITTVMRKLLTGYANISELQFICSPDYVPIPFSTLCLQTESRKTVADPASTATDWAPVLKWLPDSYLMHQSIACFFMGNTETSRPFQGR